MPCEESGVAFRGDSAGDSDWKVVGPGHHRSDLIVGYGFDEEYVSRVAAMDVRLCGQDRPSDEGIFSAGEDSK